MVEVMASLDGSEGSLGSMLARSRALSPSLQGRPPLGSGQQATWGDRRGEPEMPARPDRRSKRKRGTAQAKADEITAELECLASHVFRPAFCPLCPWRGGVNAAELERRRVAAGRATPCAPPPVRTTEATNSERSLQPARRPGGEIEQQGDDAAGAHHRNFLFNHPDHTAF